MERRRSRTASLPPLWLLEHSTRGYREVKAPLGLFFTGWTKIWRTAAAAAAAAVRASSEGSSGSYPHGQTDCCLPNTVVHLISLILLLPTGYNHSNTSLYFFPIPPFSILCYSSCVNVSARMRMSFSQNTVQAAGKRGADRQMCPNPLAYE